MEQKNILEKLNDGVKNVFSKFDGTSNYIEDKIKNIIIGVYGTCGGIGVTSFIHELTFRLASLNKKILVIDGNFLSPLQNIYYREKKLNFSDLIQLPYNSDFNLSDYISAVNNNISFMNQAPLSLLSLIKIDEKQSNYNKIDKIMGILKENYDIILIDLDFKLLTTLLEQGLLKNCSQLIQINSNSISGIYNETIKTLVNFTVQPEIKENTIEFINKSRTKEKELYLPYEELYYKNYNNLDLFLISGQSLTDEYIIQFNKIYDTLLNKISYNSREVK